MPSYVVTGASRGIGVSFVSNSRVLVLKGADAAFSQYEYVHQLSEDAHNTVFALVRRNSPGSKLSTLARKNVVVLEADITDSSALKVGIPVGHEAQS